MFISRDYKSSGHSGRWPQEPRSEDPSWKMLVEHEGQNYFIFPWVLCGSDLLAGKMTDNGVDHPSCPLLRLHTGAAFVSLKSNPFIEPTDGQRVGSGEGRTAFPNNYNNMPASQILTAAWP